MSQADAGARVEIGYVAKAHGVRGDLKIVLHNPESDALERAARVFVDGDSFEVGSLRYVQGGALVGLSGCGDRDSAERLKGKTVSIARADLGLGEGEVLLADLVGCDVVTKDGAPYGVITEVMHGAQDCLVIRDGDVERLLPLVDEFVVETDIAAGRVVVDPPEDLPEDKVHTR